MHFTIQNGRFAFKMYLDKDIMEDKHEVRLILQVYANARNVDMCADRLNFNSKYNVQ